MILYIGEWVFIYNLDDTCYVFTTDSAPPLPNWLALCMPVSIELQLWVSIGAQMWIECSDLIIFNILSSILCNWSNYNPNINNNR